MSLSDKSFNNGYDFEMYKAHDVQEAIKELKHKRCIKTESHGALHCDEGFLCVSCKSIKEIFGEELLNVGEKGK